MKKLLKIEKRYLNIPINSQEKETGITICNLEDGAILRYFFAAVSFGNYEFISFYDLSEFFGRELEFEVDNEKILNSFQQSDEPLGLENLYCEEYRPQFHFSSRRGWMNEPNGLVYYNQKYHLFYQHNPFGISWGNMHWGHAVSSDMIHWEEIGNALFPDNLGAIFSGGAVVDWNNTSGLQENNHPPIVLFYTAAGIHAPEPCKFTQCLAYSVDGGVSFKKYKNNPIVGYLEKEARDPMVVWHSQSGKWIMALHLGDEKGIFALLKSENLINWEPIQEIELPGGRECPGFFPISPENKENEMKWIFLEANGLYFIGEFDGDQFTVEEGPYSSFCQQGEDNIYAGQVWSDAPENRKILIAWQRGEITGGKFNQSLTFPVDLKLRKFSNKLKLCAHPIPEIEDLYLKSWSFRNVNFGDFIFPDNLQGEMFDLEMIVETKTLLDIKISGFNIVCDPKRSELRIGSCLFKIDRHLDELDIRILADRTSVEFFADRGRCWMGKRALSPRGLKSIFSVGGSGIARQIKVRKLKSIWK